MPSEHVLNTQNVLGGGSRAYLRHADFYRVGVSIGISGALENGERTHWEAARKDQEWPLEVAPAAGLGMPWPPEIYPTGAIRYI